MTLSADSNGEHRFTEEYGRMGEAELLTLASSYDALIGPAQDALRAEFARRGMEPPLIEEADVLESRALVTVRRYRDLSEAMVARTVVESAGIYCFLRDENLVRLDWQVSNFIGGLSLQVQPEDAGEAMELLDQPAPESIAFDGREDYEQPHCPRCGSTDISFEGSNRKAAIASVFLIGVPLPLGGTSWSCQTCGCRWADEADDMPHGDGERSEGRE
jgi:hypothetical protein